MPNPTTKRGYLVLTTRQASPPSSLTNILAATKPNNGLFRARLAGYSTTEMRFLEP